MKTISNIMTSVFLIALLALSVVGAPVLNSISSQTVSEGSTLKFNITSTAPDSGNTAFSFTSSPSASFISINTINNTLAEVTVSPGYSNSGTYGLTFNATDSNSSSSQTATITVNDASALSVSAVSLGDEDQERGVGISKTFTVTNSDPTSSITGLSFSTSITKGTASDYNINFTNQPTSIAANQSETVTMNVFVPLSFDASTSSCIVSSFQIGTLTVSGSLSGASVSNTATITMQAENKLRIKKAKVCVESKCEKVDDNDDVKDIKPGDDVDVEVTVENKFNDNDDEDFDIEDVEVMVEIDDNDLDVDEDDDIGDLNAEEEEETTLSFDVDDDANDQTYDMKITACGEDENGAQHGETFNIDFKVERKKHDITIRRADLSPDRISCTSNTRTAEMRVGFVNIGTRDEDEVAIEVSAPDLGFSETRSDIELDEDDSDSETFTITVPDNTKAGTYRVDVKSYYDNTIKSDQKTANLVFDECAVSTTTTTTTTTDTTTDTTTVDTTTDVTTTTTPVVAQPPRRVTTSAEKSFTESAWYIALLVVIVLIVVGAIVLIGVKFLAKRD